MKTIEKIEMDVCNEMGVEYSDFLKMTSAERAELMRKRMKKNGWKFKQHK